MNEEIRDTDGNYISGSLESVKEQGEVMTPPRIVDAMLEQSTLEMILNNE